MERRETRVTDAMQMRAEETSDGLTLRGYATTFDSEYEITDALGTYVERVAPGAFTRTLDHGADVRLLINHDGLPLARTKSGTLALEQDDTGLLCEARLDGESPLVRSLKSAMDRGDADQMSFAFRVVKQDWNDDYTDRTIREAQLFDVSVVTYPANPATSVSLRTAASLRGLDLEAFGPDYADLDPDTVRQMLRGEMPSTPVDLTWQRLRAAALSL
jgi:HK97 family phage prohead protease